MSTEGRQKGLIAHGLLFGHRGMFGFAYFPVGLA